MRGPSLTAADRGHKPEAKGGDIRMLVLLAYLAAFLVRMMAAIPTHAVF